MKFELDTTDGRARRGRTVFDRGVVERLVLCLLALTAP